MKKVLIPLAPGFEEVEALTCVDILRRAGAEVTLAGTIEGEIIGRNLIKVSPDTLLESVKTENFDMIVLPGGALGTENLKKDDRIKNIVLEHYCAGRLIAAICAAPTVLAKVGIIKGRVVTSHPSVRTELNGAVISDERVVTNGNIITSQGPGTAMEFAFTLVKTLFGSNKAMEVNKGVLAKY
jgi:4-methyl-5(b-hydroxyethyl)-thiazole monophosphate biosynthesis